MQRPVPLLLMLCALLSARAQVNCRVGQWGSWQPCNRSCGRGGKEFATRRIEQRAAYGGALTLGCWDGSQSELDRLRGAGFKALVLKNNE